MNMHFKFDIGAIGVAAVLLAGCGGGGHSGSDGGAAMPPPSSLPPIETVNFNATVQALATQPESPDNSSSAPMDINSPLWQFDNEDENAFDDVFL